jgi:cyclopropane-fatty-acyl-phospholipid synthase
MKSDKNPLSNGAASVDRGAWTDTDTVWPIETWLFNRFMRLIGEPAISVVFWDDREHYRCTRVNPVARMRFADRPTFWRLFTNPNLEFGDGYSSGRIRVEGDLVAFIEALYEAKVKRTRPGILHQFVKRGFARPRRNSLTGSRDNIQHHYDLGNDFYRLWLDEEMAYTCAYFADPSVTLEQAQAAKLDHIARKLQLRPGEEVVEAGLRLGRPGTALCASLRREGPGLQHLAVADRLCARAGKAEGLADRIDYIEDDYRNIQGTYDAFVSVGMLEHVGAEHYATLGQVVDRALKDDGRGLIHSIGQVRPEPPSAWNERRIFPGANPPTLRQMMDIFEGPGSFGYRRGEHPPPLRQDDRALAGSATRHMKRRSARCSTTSSCGPGGSISRRPSPASAPAPWSSIRSCSRARARTTWPGHVLTSTGIKPRPERHASFSLRVWLRRYSRSR